MPLCTHCGAPISLADRTCPHCGAENADYRPPEAAISALLEAGLQAFQQEDYTRAIECYEQVVAQDANIFDAYFYLAASYHALKWYEKAIAAMERARAIRPDNAPVYYNLALFYRAAGYSNKKVCDALQQALKRADPDATDFRRRVEQELKRCRRKRLPWQR